MAIAFNNRASAVSLTVAHTIAASGNSRILMAFYHANGPSSVASEMTACTYNGVAADGSFFVEATRWGNSYGITAFYWLEASLPSSAGSYNCVATAGTGQWGRGGYTASFTGVNQVAPTMASNFDADPGVADDSTVSITTPAANSVICDAGGFWAGTSGTITAQSGQTKLGEIYGMGVGYEAIATAGSSSQDWSQSVGIYTWQAAAFAFGPAGGATTPKYNMLGHNF